MNRIIKICTLFLFITGINLVESQDIELFEQFNGRFDYIAIGNTMNLEENENSDSSDCNILNNSSAMLSLNSNQTIEAAYLYWAGSGNGDFDVTLNSTNITANRTFLNTFPAFGNFFAAFADITPQIIEEGSINYTLSNLDLPDDLQPFCNVGVNFAGWSIIVIYEDSNLPLNQVNVYDGLQSVPPSFTIELDNLNVLDNAGAKIGFLAWEGDSALAVNEQLSINGNVLENLPLNPSNNAFNGTNSFTGQSDLYNMDIDVYNIENNINIGDSSAIIELTSGQDVVLVNNIITVLNSQLPDATINLENVLSICASQFITIDYTVFNNNSTDNLPSGTPIAFYIDGILIGTSETENIIPIDESETNSITLNIPETLTGELNLLVVVDDDGTGIGVVTEINEDNNSDFIIFIIEEQPLAIELEPLTACNIGFNSAEFDLTLNLDAISFSNIDLVTFYESIDDLILQSNEILNPENYINSLSPQTIYVRVKNDDCFDLYIFKLLTKNCPPIIPEGFSPNEDGKNDWFNIQGLYNIFENHKLLIYNRYGSLIFEGNNDKMWYGKANKGLPTKNKLVPTGTYFYVLYLNDSNYKPITGWVYLNR